MHVLGVVGAMPLYLYYGDESYLLERELKALRAKIVNPDMAALSHSVLKSPSIGEVMESVGTVRFSLGGDTLIEVLEFRPLEKAAESDADKRMLDDLKEMLTNVETTKHVLFVKQKVDRKVGFAKWLSGYKGAEVRDFKRLDPWKTDDAVQLIIQEARRQKIEIANAAAMLLVEHFGTELQVLMNEIQKLAIYAHGRAITVNDVNALSNHNDNTFRMLSYWVANQKRGEVFQILDELLLRQHPLPLFGLIQSYLNNAYRLKLWQQLGIPQSEMVERTKKHPYKLKMDLQEFAPVPIQRLSLLKERTLDLEWKMKTGQITDRLALEMLLGA